MADTHHLFGPSTLKHRWICPGWTNDKTSDPSYAAEGTMMHRAAETNVIPTAFTPEQAHSVQMCIDYVFRLERGAIKVLKEVRLEVLGGKTFGTADRVVYRMKDGKKHVDVVDFKFGKLPVDDAEDNMQGHAYLLGAWDLFPEAETGSVHFLQPRLDVVDVAHFDRAKDYNRLALPISLTIDRAAEYERTENDTMLVPTVDNCLYCGRKVGCSRIRFVAYGLAKKYAPLEIVDEVHSSAITNPQKMAELFAVARVMEKMIESIKTHAMELALENGGTLNDAAGNPIYEVSERAGTREITNLGLALPALSKYLDDREMLQVAKVSLPGALKLIGDKAERGKKAKVMGAVQKELQELDAISTGEPIRYLKKVRN